MLETSLAGLFSLVSLLYLCTGIVFGLIVGVLPGLGGMFALSMVLPLLIGLDAYPALALFIGVYASTPAGGAITAILLGVPGTVSSAATVLDGFPMGKQGKAGEAIGAALSASAVGGIVGALVLLSILPILKKVVLAFGPAEMVLLTLLGVSFVGILGEGGGVLKAFLSGCLGLLLATVRLDLVSGIERFTFGIVELWDGLPLIPVVLGLFALAEMIELSKSGGDFYTGKHLDFRVLRGMWQGVKITFSKLLLVVRCSGLGALIGIIPGLGGETAIFLAYGHAAQTSKESDKFGQGAIEGVIAPESANNAKEGGALVPTIGLGVPGSGLMALFFGAFMILGFYPGPGMLLESLDVVLLIIWAMMLASILASILAFIISSPMIRAVYKLKGAWLAVSVVVLASYGVYLSRGSIVDLVILLFFGLLGVFMKLYKFPRASLLVGFILGNLLETNVQKAFGVYGWNFFLQPIALTILLIIIAGIVIPTIIRRGQKKEMIQTDGEKVIGAAFICLFGFTGFYALTYGIPSAIAPTIISLIGIAAGIVYFAKSRFRTKERKSRLNHFDAVLVLFVSLFILMTYLLGFFLSSVLFMLLFLLFIKKETLVASISLTSCIILFVYAISLVFGVALPEGALL